MFLNFAINSFKLRYHVEPDTTAHLGSFPEEEPIVHLYELSAGDMTKIWMVQQNQASLVSGEVKDEAELAAIKSMKALGSQIQDIEKL